MHNESEETCKIYGTYLDKEYCQLLEANPKSVEELVDNMPFTGGFWDCRKCRRLFFFKEGKMDVYKLETEY